MASRSQANKALLDIEDCILELKNCFLETNTPINDDNITLHRFEEKLELVLQLGLKEKPGLLGTKKSFWDYICFCFSSSKRTHEGVKFVKSVTELKTSLGRGRAFVRFCLMQKCLADTLQSCFMNHKATRDFYTERSFAAQASLWSALITSLYDLNELNFDLISRNAELDVSWPTFARKHFASTEDKMILNRTSSFSAQSEYGKQVEFKCDVALAQQNYQTDANDESMVNYEVDKLVELNEELSHQNECLQKEVRSLVEEKSLLQIECQNLQQKLHDKLLLNTESNEQVSLNKNISVPTACVQIPREIISDSQMGVWNLNEFEESAQQLTSLSLPESKSSILELKVTALHSENEKLLKTLAGFEQRLRDACGITTFEELKSSVHGMLEFSNKCCSRDELSLLLSWMKCEESEIDVERKHFSSETSSDLQKGLDENNLQISNSCDIETQYSSNILDVNVPYSCSLSDSKISELLLEMKVLLDSLSTVVETHNETLAVSQLSQLKTIRDYFERQILIEIKNLKKFLNQNQFVTNYIDCFKHFVRKQDDVINSLQQNVDISIKGNRNLYSKICTLKDLLRSYGFNKISYEKFDLNAISAKVDDSLPLLALDNDVFLQVSDLDPALKHSFEPLLPIVKSSFSKLSNLNAKIMELQIGLDLSQELNSNLISKVRDQEMHMKGVTKELEEAQQLISVLKEQHRKLQSTEGILKYDLQEKRKLVSRLKKQLETTREDWNLVRQKNSESEVEWQNLRKEFVQRHKQTSEESGFVDDKGIEEQSNIHVSATDECSCSDENNSDDSLNNCPIDSKDHHDVPIKKSRLELLEEQCQLLYSSLLQGSKRRQEIDNRLETMVKAVEKTTHKNAHNENSPIISTEGNCEHLSDILAEPESEEICENALLSTDNFTGSPQSSSDIGSFNSDRCSYMPINSTISNKQDTNFSCECSKSDECLPSCDLCSVSSTQDICVSSVDAPHFPSSNSHDYCDNTKSVPSFEPLANIQGPDTGVSSLLQVDSLSFQTRNLEESAIHLEIREKNISSDENKLDYAKLSKDFTKQISALEKEKRILENKIQELEKKNLIISTELDQTTQQLILSKAAKEHEVAALQFQLNTEALKYERALQQFSEQNNGLETMKQKVNDQEQLIFALEEALTEIRLERESEKEHQWQELQDIQFALEAREQECVALCEDLEKSVSFVEEERNKNDLLISQLDEVKSYSQRQKEAMEAELVHLQNDSRELRKKLIKLLKEKDILWKRNDHLSHLQKIKIDDRWMEDRETSSCLGCRSNFSFILRKHHCRHCGRIFCHSCSNNWLLTASSRKRIRVCNECYMQHMEMKKEVRRGSDVPQIEDDSEDEAVVDDFSLNPTSNSSFNSEVPLSITDSIISLPVRDVNSSKQSTPYFASAPDLRCVLKNEESCTRPRSMVCENLEEEIDEKSSDFDVNGDEDFRLPLVFNQSNISLLEGEDNDSVNTRISVLNSITVDEIETAEQGLSGELSIKGGDNTVLPIVCAKCPLELQWTFKSICETFPITILYETDGDATPTVCYHNDNKTEDSMKLSNPGLYTFQFENPSRSTTMKVNYNLKVQVSSNN